MPTIVGVKLRFAPKVVWFGPAGTDPALGDGVVVETERGIEIGQIADTSREVQNSELRGPLRPIVRLMTDEDASRVENLAEQERAAMPVFRELITQYKLDMKAIDVEYLFDGDKVVFYFVAEERVDFREMVKDLASRFHARIDMRQVGVRDEARMVGGLGHCGEQLCCVRFGGEFQPVSIRMAKEQDLPLNPLKISGLCGRLMCCLRYEYEAYKDYKGRAPKRGTIIETPLGLAKVSDLNTPHETVGMKFEDGRRVAVPLADMECCKGTGCPCSVSREVLEAIGSTGTAMAFAALDREAEAAAAPPVAEKPRERRDKRESKPRAAGRTESRTEQTRTEPSSDAEKASDAPKGEGRKRRRRGGGKGGEGAASTEKSAGQASSQPASKPESSGAGGAESGSAKPSRRRRRRRPGSGGASDGGGSAPAE